MPSNPRIDDLRKRLEREPGSRLFAQLAEELRKVGELDEAIRLSLDGLQRHPTYPSARMTLGRCLLDKGDLMAARREFEAVLKGAPDNILASRFLADSLEGLGDLQGAAEQQRAALRLSPGDPQTLQRLADLERKLAAGPPAALEPQAIAEAHVSEVANTEPAPIPLSSVEDEAFELERPYEAPVRASIPAGSEPLPGPVSPPIPAAERAGVFDFEPQEPAMASTVVEALQDRAPLEVVAEPAPEAEPIPAVMAPPLLTRGDSPAPASIPAFRHFEDEPPPPWAAPAAVVPEPGSAPAGEEIASSTLAELYFNQGFSDKAIEVYRQVLAREPGNDRVRVRLAELEGLTRHSLEESAAGSQGQPPTSQEGRREGLRRAINGLEKMLASVRRE